MRREKKFSSFSNSPEWFAKPDKDAGGKISLAEIKLVDNNMDKKISLEEAQSYGSIEIDFKKLDKNGDANLTLEEMRPFNG